MKNFEEIKNLANEIRTKLEQARSGECNGLIFDFNTMEEDEIDWLRNNLNFTTEIIFAIEGRNSIKSLRKAITDYSELFEDWKSYNGFACCCDECFKCSNLIEQVTE